MKIILITGPPYSGKGTQCENLKKLLNFKHISTGDRCRLEKANNSEIGKILATYEENGALVPDSVMKSLLSQILEEQKDSKGIILDGYPRTIPQVKDLISLAASKNMEIDKVIYIDVPKPELLLRAHNRAKTSSRKDDKDPAIHVKRINVYEQLTKPAIAFMKTRLDVATFNGLGSIEEITARITASFT